MIRLDALTKRYPDGTVAVDALSLDVPRGQVVALVGPSGCGKTTTLKMVNRLVEPTSGRVFVGGDDVTTVDAVQLRRHIGYVIQSGGLFPHRTVADNVATVLTLLGWDAARKRTRVAEMLALVGLQPDVHGPRYPAQLSGGQRQRVGVARALAADPPVLLMDEPFGAVDPLVRERLQTEFARLQRELGTTVLFVTHDIDEAVRLGDAVAVLNHGRLEQYARPERLLAAPASDFVADFVGSDRVLRRLRVLPLPLDAVAADEPPPADAPRVAAQLSSYDVLAAMLDAGTDRAVVVDGERVLGVLRLPALLAPPADAAPSAGAAVTPGR